MIVFMAMDCHAHTITIAIHAVLLLESILELRASLPSASPSPGRIYVKKYWKIYPTTSAPSTLGMKYAARRKVFPLILLLSPSARRRLITFVRIVATIASLMVNQ